VFDVPVPEELNTGHFLTVVAGDLDPESERIVNLSRRSVWSPHQRRVLPLLQRRGSRVRGTDLAA
jgi:hypothetical protein